MFIGRKDELNFLEEKYQSNCGDLMELDNYTSYIFEDVCKAFLRRMNRNEELPFHFSKIGRWWDKTDELDIMAMDHSKKNYILGECKYKNQPFAMSDLKNMKKKVTWLKEDANVSYWIFSKSGYVEEVRKIAEEENIRLVGLEEIVAKLIEILL